MNEMEKSIILHRLERAHEALASAAILLEVEDERSAVNRASYASFYAVSALLRCDGYSSSKHTGIRSLFFLHWIKPGKLPVELGNIYGRLFDQRIDADYQDFYTIEEQQADKLLAGARELVAVVTAEVEARLAEQREE